MVRGFLICLALILSFDSHSAAFPKFWDVYTYSSGIDNWDRCVGIAKSGPEFCERYYQCGVSPDHPNPPPKHRFCSSPSGGYCTSFGAACVSQTPVTPVTPKCLPPPKNTIDVFKVPAGFTAQGKVRIDSTSGQCGCLSVSRTGKLVWLDNSFVNEITEVCYGQTALSAKADPGRYNLSRPDGKSIITLQVNNSAGDGQSTTLKLAMKNTRPGTAVGTLSSSIAYTDGNGRATVEYSFPKFSKAQVDKVVVTCDMCSPSEVEVEIKMAPVVVGLFNGVWNAEPDATRSLEKLRESVDALKSDLPIDYDHFYNQTGCGQLGTTCLQDLAETFIQRQKELDGVLANRAEHFWDVLAGRYADVDSLTGNLIGYLGNAELAFASLFDATFNAMLGQMAGGWARMLSNPPTDADMANQLARLQKHAEAGSALILVGHSQGNLFLNAAYDGIQKAYPQTSSKAIHIGPASPTLRGPYVLADIDLVINALRVQGVSSVPLANLSLSFSRADASGHMLIGTYMDRMRNGLLRISELLASNLKY